jgi:hypothetical protein
VYVSSTLPSFPMNILPMLSAFWCVVTRFSHLAGWPAPWSVSAPELPLLSPGCSTNRLFSTSKAARRSPQRAGAPRRSRKALNLAAGADQPAKCSAFVPTFQKLSGRIFVAISPLVHGRNSSKFGAYPPSTFHTKPQGPRAKNSWPVGRGVPRIAAIGRFSKRTLAAPAVAIARAQPFAPLPRFSCEIAIRQAI